MTDPFPIVQNINSQIEEKFKAIGQPVYFKKGTLILEAGIFVKGIYYITKGKIDCFKISADGRKKTTLIAGPGSVLSDMPIFDEGPQPCNYLALDNINAYYVDKSTIQKVILEDSTIKDYMILSICKKFRATANQLIQICFDDAGCRVARILLRFAEHYGIPLDNGQSIKIECVLTQQFISDLVGINRTTTSRIISLLKNDGILDIKHSKYIIKDAQKLRSWGLNNSFGIVE